MKVKLSQPFCVIYQNLYPCYLIELQFTFNHFHCVKILNPNQTFKKTYQNHTIFIKILPKSDKITPFQF